MAKFRIDDYSGGLTDFIFSGNPSEYEAAENLLITKERGLITRNGSQFYDDNNPRIPAGNQRVGHLRRFEEELLIQSSTKVYKDFANLTGPGGSDVFLSGSVSNYVDFAEWNGHLISVSDSFAKPSKIYKDDNGDFQVRTAGLEELASDPTITPDANDGDNYLYRFIYFYEYNVKGIDYNDLGPYRQVEVLNASDFSGAGHYHTISNIPALLGDNYDFSNIKVKIYRTISNGTTFYEVGETSYTSGPNMDNFVDQVDDTTLINNALMYTEGGVVENDQCPPAKFVTMANNIVWYANVQENGVNRFNRVRQSIQLDPDSCPVTFFVDLDSEIKGIGTVKNYPIVFCESGSVYRLEGFFDFLGRGNIVPRKISDRAGCLSNNSIVETEDGLYWAGKDGFYGTDGFEVRRAAETEEGNFKLRDTYAALTNTDAKKARIYGCYDRENRRIYWSMSGSSDNEDILIYDQTFDGFTSMMQDEAIPSALVFDDDGLIRADGRGYVFHHLDTNFTDKNIEISVAPSNWYETAIIYRFKHIAFDYGEPELTKWVNKVNVVAQNLSNLDLQVNSYDDGSVVAVALKEIEYKDVMTWLDVGWIWRDSEAVWREKLEIQRTRRMKKSANGVRGSIRNRYKQIELTNAYTIVDWSDNNSVATVDATAKTITLDNTTYSFPNNSEGYAITLASDNYATEYEVSAVNLDANGVATSLTLLDPNNTLSNLSGEAWQLNGYAKNQRLHLDSVTHNFQYLPDKDKGGYYRNSQADGNS